MAVEQAPEYTVEQYLALEREAETKSEYVGGLIYAMAGGSPEHNAIAHNLAGELYAGTRSGPCRGYSSDQRVQAGEMITYPDLVYVCERAQFLDERRDTLTNPTLVIEVLSEATEGFDRGAKFAHYRQVPSLQEVVLVAQDHPHIEVFRRSGPNGEWALSEAMGLDGQIALRSIGCTLRLADVYRGIEFPKKPTRRKRSARGKA